MKVTKLILRNCDRFLLNQIKEVVYTPESPYQLITGNNGSGKSSLLEEISPLPPDKNKFTKNGYKEIHIEHEGKKYILKNDFTKGSSGTHSFLCNGEELNDGQNVTTQLLLVKEHFRYTKEIHELVIGKRLFTTMTSLQRRDWFVKIANVDMDYIMNVFNNVRNAHRDNIGAIKLQEKRLASSIEQLLGEEKQKELEQEVDGYRFALDKLDEFLPKEFERVAEIESQLDAIINQIGWYKNPAQGMNFDNKFKGEGLDGLALELDNVSSLLRFKREELAGRKVRLRQLEEELSTIDWNNAMTDDQIKDAIYIIDKRLKEMKGEYTFNGDVTDAIEKVRKLQPQFEMWCSEAPTNTDGRFNRDKVNEAKQRYENLNGRKTKIQAGLQQINDTITHIRASMFKTKCPHCQSEFPVALNSEKLPIYEAKLKEGNELLDTTLKELKEVEEYLEEVRRREESLEFCKRSFFIPYPEFRFFFDGLLAENFLDTPMVAVGKMTKLITYLEECREFKKLQEDKLFYIELYNKRQKTDGAKLKGSRDEVAEGIDKIQAEINRLQMEEMERKANYAEAQTLLRTYAEMTECFETYESVISKLNRSLEYEEASYLKNELLHQYRNVSEMLSEAKTKRRVVEDIKNYLEELNAREISYKMLIDVLNPNDGLIAKSLLGFIHHFLDQFNQLIGHIWSYDMKIVAEDSADFTKNYNFPLKQANKENPSSDVRESSKGQREMVDFAFLMLVMRYLGLEHFPLLLDELGGGFTEEHRIHILNYLKQMVETGQIEQMFLISHNSSSHDTLNLADVVCFDTNGVMQNERVNRVIQFN